MKTRSIFLLLPILFAAVLIVSSLVFSIQAQASPTDPSTFTVTQITANTVEDQSPTVAVDHNSALHIAYMEDGTATYMTNASGSWITTTVGATNTEFNPSIAVDDAGYIHISYYVVNSPPAYDIYYATNAPAGSWYIEYVTTIEDMNTCHSTGGIAVDGGGTPYIIYTTYDGSEYQVEMRYYDSSHLHSTTGGWTTGFFTSSSDHNHPSIDVEDDGTVHLTYQTYKTADGSWDLVYATNASTSWITTTISGPEYKSEENPSIVVDEQGKAHIAYLESDFSDFSIRYTSNANGIWATETVFSDSLIINDRPAITLDNKGKPHIAIWSHNLSYYVTHATKASGSWATTGMHITDTNLGEMDRTINIDQEGYVHIVHTAPVGGDHEIYHAKSGQSFGAAENGTCALPRIITCGEQVSGDTTSLSNNISSYGCATWDESGPEEIWAFTLAAGNNYSITADLLGVSANLDIFLLDPGGCDSGTCLGPNAYGDWRTSVDSLPGGNTFYIAVDGRSGAQGSYTMQLNCNIVQGENFPATPHTPQPVNGAINIRTNPLLSWVTGDADGDTITGSVYGSTSNASIIHPNNLWCSDSNQGDPVTQSCTPADLLPNSTYYWRVVVFDGGESVDGPIWSFTTGSSTLHKIFLPMIIKP